MLKLLLNPNQPAADADTDAGGVAGVGDVQIPLT